MYPKQHAVVSGAVTLLFAVWMQVEPLQLVLWAVIGVIAGVFIDVDHVLLGMLVDGRIDEGVKWFTRPVAAITQPDALLADMEYDGMLYHRLFSHLLALTLLIALIRVHVLVLPAAVGLTAHIAADIAWDAKQGSYEWLERPV